jgi:hypothetical protein
MSNKFITKQGARIRVGAVAPAGMEAIIVLMIDPAKFSSGIDLSLTLAQSDIPLLIDVLRSILAEAQAIDAKGNQ